ncbi:fimbrial protein [Serratia silvae]|uniref:Fimbrial protein n=1 Tax=Serratia silvae TaxID=2824122 RepID=A0ABT0KDM5_9GAMM|nr:fimbrial protein [Serratia silvae]MCL1030134.1 fimbrial protein [Serratia silvae]
MNKVQSIVRRSVMGIALVGGLGTMQQALAEGTGPCWPVDAPHQYTVNFDKEMLRPDDNAAGKPPIKDGEIDHDWKGSGAAPYLVKCQCSNNQMSASYISAQPTEEMGGIIHTDDGWNFYLVPGTNKTLAIASQVYIGGATNRHFSVPFVGVSNGWEGDTSSCDGTSSKGKEYASGGNGMINLLIVKPFVGVMPINAHILDIYIAAKQSGGSVSGNPVAKVTINGTVKVHQSCEIHNAAIPINFGDIMSESFKVAGEMPVGFDNVYKGHLTMDCGNISNGVEVYLTLKGEPNIHNKTALRTTKEDGSENEDIGIRFINNVSPGEPVIIPSPSVEDAPSSASLLPVKMTGLGQLISTGETSFLAYPISTTGKPPEVGKFNATATLNVHLESKN